MQRAVIAIVLALLVACSDSGSNESAAPPPSTAPAATSTTTTTVACEPGGRTVTRRGLRVRQFCGPAAADVRVGNETLRFEGGECARHEEWLAVNIGFEVIEPLSPDEVEDPAFRSFTMLMGKHPLAASDAAPVAQDGVFTEGVITFAAPGRGYLVKDKTVTLVGTRTAATFAGTGFAGNGPDQPLDVRGTVTCDNGAIPLEEVAAMVEAPGP